MNVGIANIGGIRPLSLDYELLDYALSVRRRLFSLLFNRAARLLWCSPLDAARSILDTASRYAVVAPSLSLSEINFSNFLMDERSVERWLILCNRRFVFCRARFRACGELAKRFPLNISEY